MTYLIRPVDSLVELASVFDLMGAQMDPQFSHEARQFATLHDRFEEDRSMMLVVECDGRVVGGAFAFRTASEARATVENPAW